jgi:protein-S-isoprenylcysteine O-methyltransferase Ste14
MLDGIRYFLGVATAMTVVLGIVYWLIIHSLAWWWRRWGPMRTYLAVLPVMAVGGVLLFRIRGQLLGRDLGTSWTLVAVAVALSVPMFWLESQYWRQLKISTLVGVPELSASSGGTLMRDGIYSVVRHPRYLSAGIGLLFNGLIINYQGLYILMVAAILPGYLMLLLEERELVQRFGDAYLQYQRDVPQLIPHLRRRS